MNIITISNLYPRPDRPTMGMFNAQLFGEMGKLLLVNSYSLLGGGKDEIEVPSTSNQEPTTNNHYQNICLVPEWRVWRWGATGWGTTHNSLHT
jgi:hypothetical protein